MGPSGADDMIYISVVEKLLQQHDVGDTISSSKHWGVRLGLIFPVWGFMKLFGISEISSYLFPLAASSGIIIFIYIAGLKLFSPQVALISALLFSLLPQDVYLSTVVYPDGPVVLFSALFIYLFYRLSGKDNLSIKEPLIAGLVLGIAYFIRETSLILLITVPILFFNAPDKKQFCIKAVFVFVGLLIAVSFEMLIFWLLTDDPIARWNILLGKTKVLEPREFTVYSPNYGESKSLYMKYLFDPIMVIFATHWISPLMITTIGGVFFLMISGRDDYRYFSFKKGHFLWLFILSFGILGYYTYGPIYGLTVPLKREVRYYHTVTPLVSLLAGVVIYELFSKKGFKKFVGYSLIVFYVFAASVCLGSITNKNVHGLELIEDFILKNPADNYVMPSMLKKTLQFRNGSDFKEHKIVTYNYDVRLKMGKKLEELLTDIRQEDAVQYIFVIPKIHQIQIVYGRPVRWPIDRMSPVKVITTDTSISCNILRANNLIFNLTPDLIKSRICYFTDVHVYKLK